MVAHEASPYLHTNNSSQPYSQKYREHIHHRDVCLTKRTPAPVFKRCPPHLDFSMNIATKKTKHKHACIPS